MKITIPEAKIKSRIQASTKLIQKFSKTINCIRDPTSQTNSYVIVGSDSSTTDKKIFKINKNLYGSYREIWNLQQDNNFLLIQIYFHLFTPVGNNDMEELIALHCDLDSIPSHASHRYKIHPHLHVSCAKYDFISKTHFSLCLSNHKTIISKLEYLENMYRSFFDLVNYELIE